MIDQLPDPGEESSGKLISVEMGVVALLVVGFLVVSMILQNPFAKDANPIKNIGTILAAGVTLVIFSFLYRDNAMYKIAENLYVGVTMGYVAVQQWNQVLRPEVYSPLFQAPTHEAFWGALAYRAVPIFLGLLLVTRLSREYGWMSRYSFAILVGWGSGLGIQASMNSFILKQTEHVATPFQGAADQVSKSDFLSQGWFAANPWMAQALLILGAVVVMIGTVAVLWYFFFSVPHKRAGGAFSKVGIWFLMIAFGASFGYTVMARVSLLIGRVQFLLFDWLKLPK